MPHLCFYDLICKLREVSDRRLACFVFKGVPGHYVEEPFSSLSHTILLCATLRWCKRTARVSSKFDLPQSCNQLRRVCADQGGPGSGPRLLPRDCRADQRGGREQGQPGQETESDRRQGSRRGKECCRCCKGCCTGETNGHVLRVLTFKFRVYRLIENTLVVWHHSKVLLLLQLSVTYSKAMRSHSPKFALNRPLQ